MKKIYSRRQEALRAMLIEARQNAGLTQQQLCIRLKRDHNFVSRLESGTQIPDVLEFIDYVRALRLDPAKLIGDLP